MRYGFIRSHEAVFPVGKMCKLMRVSCNAYYSWRRASAKARPDTAAARLGERIAHHFRRNRMVYGSHRIHQCLLREGLACSRSYVALLMRRMGLRSVLRRRFVRTTDSGHGHPVAENRLGRDFRSERLGEKWVSDITYVRVGDGWAYLTMVMDLADRKILSWTLSRDMTALNTVCRAWLMARAARGITENHIFHSDRGVQYACGMMTGMLGASGATTQSMSRKGDCWDNAVAESFFKTIKGECLGRRSFASHAELRGCVEEYILWYNGQRMHSSLGYLSPLEMEARLRKKQAV